MTRVCPWHRGRLVLVYLSVLYPSAMAATRLRIEGRRMLLGGQDHSGWLPEGATVPPPTPTSEVLVDFLIEGDESGAMLYWKGRDGSHRDYWRESVVGAIEQAEFSWGILPEEWKPA